MIPTFDIAMLKDTIARTNKAIREYKEVFRESGQPRLHGNGWYSGLRHLKEEATLLYSIRAHQRGRIHVQKGSSAHASLHDQEWKINLELERYTHLYKSIRACIVEEKIAAE